jgi:hypothetical protein
MKIGFAAFSIRTPNLIFGNNAFVYKQIPNAVLINNPAINSKRCSS